MRKVDWITASASTVSIARPNGAVDFLFTSKDDSMANFFKDRFSDSQVAERTMRS